MASASPKRMAFLESQVEFERTMRKMWEGYAKEMELHVSDLLGGNVPADEGSQITVRTSTATPASRRQSVTTRATRKKPGPKPGSKRGPRKNASSKSVSVPKAGAVVPDQAIVEDDNLNLDID